jgi:hypothetical protein
VKMFRGAIKSCWPNSSSLICLYALTRPLLSLFARCDAVNPPKVVEIFESIKVKTEVGDVQ